MEYAALTDEQLLVRVADHRDESAFEELFRRYSRAVYSLVVRVLRDRDAGEDIVQDTFAAIWRAAASYRPERGKATSWVFTIARNAAVDAARSRRSASIGELPETIDPGPGPDALAGADMDAFRVHLAVDSLPPREREVISLAYFDGLSQSEVAARLELPLGTVKTRTRSALSRLSERLDREEVSL